MAPERYEGDAEDQSRESPESPESSSVLRRTVALPIALALVVVALGAGYLLGRPGYPLDTSADAGFLRDMSVHHAQAVDMSMLLLERSDDETMTTIAHDIALTQQAQIGRMRGWLVQWDLPVRRSQPQMAWMEGHEHGGGTEGGLQAGELMPGMATDEQMRELAEAEGVEAEIIFLELMIPHHESGVEMAEAASELASQPYVVELATGMAEAQTSEIEMMEDLLRERGVEPR